MGRKPAGGWTLAALALGVVVIGAGCAQRGPSPAPAGAAPPATAFAPGTEPPPTSTPAQPKRAPLPVLLAPSPPAVSYELRHPLRRPPRVRGKLDVPIRRRWKYIVIHHSATSCGNAAEFDRHHRQERGWRGVGYDFVIDNGKGGPDGLVEVTFRWERQLTGAHAASRGNEYNEHGIGICLVGDFERGYPTARQMEALVGLVNYLQERCNIPTANIMGHRDVPGARTKCPGKNFPWYEFLSLLEH